MKKKLLYLTSIVLFSASSINAQIKVWNFATDNLPGYNNVIDTNAKVDAILYSAPSSVLFLSGAPSTSNVNGSFGVATDKVFYVNATVPGGDRLRLENTAITSYNTENLSFFDSFFGTDAPWGRFYLNGNGSNTRRYFGFNLVVGESITMYYYIDTSVDGEKLTVESPTGVLTDYVNDNLTLKTGHVLNLVATEAGLYKVYAKTGKLCVGRIYEANVTLPSLGLETKSAVTTNVHAADNRIYVSNVKSSTQVEVYSMTGSLVKSLKTESDTNFDLKTGVYIVNAKSAEGTKSVKVIVK